MRSWKRVLSRSAVSSSTRRSRSGVDQASLPEIHELVAALTKGEPFYEGNLEYAYAAARRLAGVGR
ncbi:hypothetical protein [Nocardioides sp. TF02-7]|uniref:hypothetical protein n=1 Tax=Nocardioides sp. TF02-7 TaxID=2917724 RepID=UPI001F05A128|nr:hypothetical protein [Nocardioides sp. TF02-7]UMG91016.1 hypothetical protein MF408_12325 [Nocardioides sp. TF02-7]